CSEERLGCSFSQTTEPATDQSVEQNERTRSEQYQTQLDCCRNESRYRFIEPHDLDHTQVIERTNNGSDDTDDCERIETHFNRSHEGVPLTEEASERRDTSKREQHHGHDGCHN